MFNAFLNCTHRKSLITNIFDTTLKSQVDQARRPANARRRDGHHATLRAKEMQSTTVESIRCKQGEPENFCQQALGQSMIVTVTNPRKPLILGTLQACRYPASRTRTRNPFVLSELDVVHLIILLNGTVPKIGSPFSTPRGLLETRLPFGSHPRVPRLLHSYRLPIAVDNQPILVIGFQFDDRQTQTRIP